MFYFPRDYFKTIPGWSDDWSKASFCLFQINGKLTLGENIADNGGFKASHRVGAFKSKKLNEKMGKKEKKRKWESLQHPFGCINLAVNLQDVSFTKKSPHAKSSIIMENKVLVETRNEGFQRVAISYFIG